MSRYSLLATCAVLVLYGAVVCAADQDTPAPTPPPSKDAAPAFNPKNTFRNICGFCHENYGRKAGKGPQLMGTQSTDEQIFDRIKNGKPGRMAAFGGNFTDDQIHQLVSFIRALRPDVDP
jgi:mono/diheme cytochrome c family protein